MSGLKQLGLGLAAAIASIVLLSGCGNTSTVGALSADHSQTAATIRNTSHLAPPSSTSPAPLSATVGLTNPSNTPGCSVQSLSLSLISRVVGAGTHIRVYAFTNTGASTCSLYGYPALELLNAQGQPLTTSESEVSDQQILVAIKPHGQAWFVVQYPDSQGLNPDSCPAAAELAVTPPNSGTPIVLKGKAGSIRAYGGTSQEVQCGQLNVQPVTPKGVPLSP